MQGNARNRFLTMKWNSGMLADPSVLRASRFFSLAVSLALQNKTTEIIPNRVGGTQTLLYIRGYIRVCGRIAVYVAGPLLTDLGCYTAAQASNLPFTMRVTRAKQYRRHLRFFRIVYGISAPYKVSTGCYVAIFEPF